MISKTHFYILATVIILALLFAIFIATTLFFTLLVFIFYYGINVHKLHKENMPLQKALLLSRNYWISIREETFSFAKDFVKFITVILLVIYIITMITMFHIDLYHLAYTIVFKK